jgi:hypothetical protein
MHNPYFREMETRYRLEEAHRIAERLGRSGASPAAPPRRVLRRLGLLLARPLLWIGALGRA